ncbi:MAG: CoA transferase [Gammaproteobacteria bacterium]|nr:CoA transferase [Gammaproteobacteria bacterium]
MIEYAGAGSGLAAAYAGWLLARMGAEITRLAVPDVHATPATDCDPVQLAAEVLTNGKVTRAMPGSHAEFEGLLAAADILLCDAPISLAALFGPLNALLARAPHVIIGCVTPFGLEGPYAGFPGTALDAQAISAVAWSLGEPARAPLTLPPGVTEHQGGAMLAAGCLLALAARDDRGTGRLVDIALADVLASYVAGNCRLYIHHGLPWQRSGRRPTGSGGAYPYAILPCKDGQVCVCGRTREEWNRLVAVMGNPTWACLPRYQDLRTMGKQYPEEVDALLHPWLSAHTMAELEALALEHNLIVSPVRGFAQVLATEHFTARGFLAPGRAAGHDVRVPGLPFRVVEARSETAPNIASALLAGPAPARASKPAHKPDRPLADVRVLDFGWVWSAPWVSTILAELGAQVIKVEHAARPDNLRLSGRIFRDGKQVEGPSKEMSPMYHQINHGKLGITLNAKDQRARTLLERLARMSDIVIENMSPGSMERLQLGFDTLHAWNPQLVMLAMSSGGQFGALSTMRAYAPTISSFVGLEAMIGYRDETPIGALNFGLGDPNASVHALAPLLAGLRRARATGQGCYIDLSLLEALAGTLRPYLIETQVNGRQPAPPGNTHPRMAPHGIYPALEADAWLTLAIADDAQWQAFVRLAHGGSFACDARFDRAPGRLAQVAELDDAVASWTCMHARDALVARLRAANIAASPVLSVEEQWRDPHFAAREIKHRVTIPIYGEEDLFCAPWRFSDFAPSIERCGPTTGEHNDYVFGELLGLPADEIAELKATGVIA